MIKKLSGLKPIVDFSKVRTNIHAIINPLKENFSRLSKGVCVGIHNIG